MRKMNKVIAHYQAACPYCKGVMKYQVSKRGVPMPQEFCLHFERFIERDKKFNVRFSVFQDVEAEEDV